MANLTTIHELERYARYEGLRSGLVPPEHISPEILDYLCRQPHAKLQKIGANLNLWGFNEVGSRQRMIERICESGAPYAAIREAAGADAIVETETKPAKEKAGAASDVLAQTLAKAIRDHLEIPPATITREDVLKEIEKRLKTFNLEKKIDEKMEVLNGVIQKKVDAISPIREIHVKAPNEKTTTLTRQHYLFPLVLKLAEQRIHGYIVGPAGSGKTQCVENAAEGLDLKFYSISVCSQSTEYVLKGYFDAQGRYVRSLFRDAYENGGVFLIDEIDAGNPNIIACLNAALSNHVCAFPDGMVKRHSNFICFAAANTWGVGSSREYVGRNPLDAATLDRFAFVEFPYDNGLEFSMVGNDQVQSPSFNLEEGGKVEPTEWAHKVQKFRGAIQKVGAKVVVSPRASKIGAELLAAGVGVTHVANMLLWKGLDKATREKITSALS